MPAFNAEPPAQLAVSILLPLLGSFIIALRFWLRITRKTGLGTDDWLCLPALVCTWGCAAVVYWGVSKHAVGQHSPPQENINAFKNAYSAQLSIVHKSTVIFTFLTYFALGFAKLSALFFYRRIFRGPIFNIVTWTLITLVLLWMLVFGLLFIFSCGTHFEYFWATLENVETSCLDVFSQVTGGAAVDFILDVFIFSVPAVMVWRLQMSRERKIGVIGVFLTGAISIAFSVLHLVGASSLAYTRVHPGSGMTLGVADTDAISVASIVMMLAMVEVGVALIAICLPTLYTGTFFHNLRWAWISRRASKRGSHRVGSKHDYRGYQATSRSNKGSNKGTNHSVRESGEDSETELRGIGYRMDFWVESQAADTRSTEAKRRYEDLFPPASGRVEAHPNEAV
ncbi:MAG: hypothetical protein Q9157_000369 [Trypethelium eluteriae]